jgi:hypothetical protein
VEVREGEERASGNGGEVVQVDRQARKEPSRGGCFKEHATLRRSRAGR